MNQPVFYQPNIIGFASYDPRKATRLILGHVQEVLEVYSLNLPLTLRQIYYRLIATHEHYPKTDVFYQKLSSIISRARRAGIIPWSAIRDDGIRHEHCGGGFAGLDDFDLAITRSANAYQRDKWQGQPKQIIAICEAGGMVEQIVSAVGDYPAIVRSSGGMDSLTSKYELAEICKDRDTVILHIGDFDPSGISIFTGIYHDVAQMIVDQCAVDNAEPPEFDCRRVTILPEHVDQYGLLTGTLKSADACKGWYPGINGDQTATCEVEALEPDVLRHLVRSAVAAEVDIEKFALAVDLGHRERAQAVNAVSDLRFDGGQL